MSTRGRRLMGLLMIALYLAGCGSPAAGAGAEDISPISGLADGSRNRSPLVTPSPVPPETAGSVELVVLHTNDNWGETEPCG